MHSQRTAYLLVGLAILILLLVPPVYRLKLGMIRYSAYEHDGQTRFARFVGPVARELSTTAEWTTTADVPYECRIALIASEDTRFLYHHGVEPRYLFFVLRRYLQNDELGWSGSTLTQQLVKNLFLSRERSATRKAREMLGALVLDALMSKEMQLTWYLNIAEFAPRVYGIEAASRHYYGRSARELNLAQCVALVSILPDPRFYSATFDEPSASLQRRRRRIESVVYRMVPALAEVASRSPIRPAESGLKSLTSLNHTGYFSGAILTENWQWTRNPERASAQAGSTLALPEHEGGVPVAAAVRF